MEHKMLYTPPVVESVDIAMEAGIASSLNEVDDYTLFEGWETV